MKNVLLTIAYDGTNFCGWAKQNGQRTVCGEVENLLKRLTGEDIVLEGTSRTDAGVHAYGQCASFKSNIKIPVDKLAKVMNDSLAKDKLEAVSDIRIVEAKEMPEDFHARFSSKGKSYIYRIKNFDIPDIFERNYYYQVRGCLDVDAMHKASRHMIGEHDFACFQTAGSPRKSTVRNIYDINICAYEHDISIIVSGNGFLYNMVRIIVGTLVEVGLGKISPEDIDSIIESKDRSRAGHTAPAQGLYLLEVFY